MNDLANINAPADLCERVTWATQWANGIVIANDETYAVVADELKAIKSAQKQADEFFDPPIKQAYELHKMLVGRKKIITQPLADAESKAKSRMLGYTTEKQRKAEEERRRLQAIADAEAEKQRKSLLAQAAKAKKPETVEKYETLAAEVVAPTVAVAVEPPKVSGQSIRTTWKHQVADVDAFIKWAAENNRIDLLLPNDKALAAYAKAMNERASIPGVKFYAEQTLASKGA